VVRLVVRQALRPVGAGVIIGLLLALLATQLIAARLFGVSQRDPLTLAGVACVLVCAGLLASVVPARRAARVDPTRALNQ
jgi:putative ABC transport system permease protein